MSEFEGMYHGGELWGEAKIEGWRMAGAFVGLLAQNSVDVDSLKGSRVLVLGVSDANQLFMVEKLGVGSVIASMVDVSEDVDDSRDPDVKEGVVRDLDLVREVAGKMGVDLRENTILEQLRGMRGEGGEFGLVLAIDLFPSQVAKEALMAIFNEGGKMLENGGIVAVSLSGRDTNLLKGLVEEGQLDESLDLRYFGPESVAWSGDGALIGVKR